MLAGDLIREEPSTIHLKALASRDADVVRALERYLPTG